MAARRPDGRHQHISRKGLPRNDISTTFEDVAVLWALSDGATRAMIVEAHHAAIRDVIDLLEREVAVTRVGASGPEGHRPCLAVPSCLSFLARVH